MEKASAVLLTIPRGTDILFAEGVMCVDMDFLEALGQLIDTKLDQKLELLEQNLEQKLDQKLEQKLDQKLDQKLEPLNRRMDRLESKVDFLEESITWMRGAMVRIEHEYSRKIDASLDSTLDHGGALKQHDKRITAVELDVERHSMQIAALQKA